MFPKHHYACSTDEGFLEILEPKEIFYCFTLQVMISKPKIKGKKT